MAVDGELHGLLPEEMNGRLRLEAESQGEGKLAVIRVAFDAEQLDGARPAAESRDPLSCGAGHLP